LFFEAKKPSVTMGRFNANRQGRGRGGRGNGNTSSGGRGGGKPHSNNNNNKSTKKTENINDFVFQPLQLGKQQASNTYDTVKEFDNPLIIQHENAYVGFSTRRTRKPASKPTSKQTKQTNKPNINNNNNIKRTAIKSTKDSK
jgi:hypothetical protein